MLRIWIGSVLFVLLASLPAPAYSPLPLQRFQVEGVGHFCYATIDPFAGRCEVYWRSRPDDSGQPTKPDELVWVLHEKIYRRWIGVSSDGSCLLVVSDGIGSVDSLDTHPAIVSYHRDGTVRSYVATAVSSWNFSTWWNGSGPRGPQYRVWCQWFLHDTNHEVVYLYGVSGFIYSISYKGDLQLVGINFYSPYMLTLLFCVVVYLLRRRIVVVARWCERKLIRNPAHRPTIKNPFQ